MWSYRELVTGVHGLLFGVFFLLASYALLVQLLDTASQRGPLRGWARTYLITAAASGWAAVFSGTFLVYPWYRAKPPAGADLHSYPRAWLLANPQHATLHTLGMEWKEHVAFLAPIAFTMLCYVLSRYGADALQRLHLRRLLLTFCAVALLATAVAAGAGALLNKAAPLTGTATLSGGRHP